MKHTLPGAKDGLTFHWTCPAAQGAKYKSGYPSGFLGRDLSLALVCWTTLLCFLVPAHAQNGPIPPPPGLVAWWPGDGNANDIVGTNNGLLLGGATFTNGMVGQAFYFNGTGAQVLSTAAALPTGSDDRSIEFWVRIDQFVAGFPYESFFCGYGEFGSDGASYHLGTTSGQLFWSSWGYTILGDTMATGEWYHVAVTSTDGWTTLYLNGAALNTDSQSFITPESSAFLMGYLDPGRTLQGALDEVSVYNRALSADEVLALYQAGTAGKIKPGPRLQIALSGGSVLVWWPAAAQGFVLEATTGMGSTRNWNAYSGHVNVIGAQNVVTIPATGGSKFFRLRQQ